MANINNVKKVVNEVVDAASNVSDEIVESVAQTTKKLPTRKEWYKYANKADMRINDFKNAFETGNLDGLSPKAYDAMEELITDPKYDIDLEKFYKKNAVDVTVSTPQQVSKGNDIPSPDVPEKTPSGGVFHDSSAPKNKVDLSSLSEKELYDEFVKNGMDPISARRAAKNTVTSFAPKDPSGGVFDVENLENKMYEEELKRRKVNEEAAATAKEESSISGTPIGTTEMKEPITKKDPNKPSKFQNFIQSDWPKVIVGGGVAAYTASQLTKRNGNKGRMSNAELYNQK